MLIIWIALFYFVYLYTKETEMDPIKEQYENRRNEFVIALQQMIDEYYKKHFSLLETPKITVNVGRKFDKLVAKGNGVHCFIERSTGDIYKAASWSAPAKHARGNIYSEDMLEGVNVYGANYL